MQTQLVALDPAQLTIARLDPKHTAILLDVDGTLIELGPSPFEVDVPAELLATLSRLFDLTNGALALVSGRSIGDLDILFAPLKLPAIGGHGAEMRLNGEIHNIAPLLSAEFRGELIGSAKLRQGIVIEDKGYSVALHYRQMPQQEAWLMRHIARVCKAFAAEPTEVLAGKMMFEVKRPAINKGESVRHLMKLEPFADRVPIFIGDDITDESVFAIMPDLGGMGFSVSREARGVAGIFKSPAHVRRALSCLAHGQMPA